MIYFIPYSTERVETILDQEDRMEQRLWKKGAQNRRYFIGGSDARIIMGDNEEALLWLWREKRGEVEPRTYPAISSSNSGW
jgi:predicted phage-related endonuclease